MEEGTGTDHRLTLPVERGMVATVARIFEALEYGERAGWHESEELVRQIRHRPDGASRRLDPPHEPIIHWQGIDPCVSEEMRSHGLTHWW